MRFCLSRPPHGCSLAGAQRLGGGGGYWAAVVLFVAGLFAAAAFVLYKFKRQGCPGILGNERASHGHTMSNQTPTPSHCVTRGGPSALHFPQTHGGL